MARVPMLILVAKRATVLSELEAALAFEPTPPSEEVPALLSLTLLAFVAGISLLSFAFVFTGPLLLSFIFTLHVRTSLLLLLSVDVVVIVTIVIAVRLRALAFVAATIIAANTVGSLGAGIICLQVRSLISVTAWPAEVTARRGVRAWLWLGFGLGLRGLWLRLWHRLRILWLWHRNGDGIGLGALAFHACAIAALAIGTLGARVVCAQGGALLCVTAGPAGVTALRGVRAWLWLGFGLGLWGGAGAVPSLSGTQKWSFSFIPVSHFGPAACTRAAIQH